MGQPPETRVAGQPAETRVAGQPPGTQVAGQPSKGRRSWVSPLGSEANALKEYLLSQPNYQIRVADLDRTLRQALPAVKKGFQKARTSLRGVLRMFPKQFKVERGLVSVVNVPAAPPEPPPAPRPETREERNARLDALLAVS